MATSRKHFPVPAGSTASVKIIDTTSNIGKLKVEVVSGLRRISVPCCKSSCYRARQALTRAIVTVKEVEDADTRYTHS
jgi:hypothetical protein